MNEVAKRQVIDLDDGFGGYTSETEGDDTVDERPNSLIVGKRIKFGKDNKYTIDGVAMPKDFQALAVKTLRAELKWGQDKALPPWYRVLAPNEKWPNIEALNKEAPKSEWITGPDGKSCGPYQNQSVLYLMGMTPAMERYTYAGTANRDHVAIEQLASTITWRRQTTGKLVYPVIAFSDTLWSKKWGMQKAYFVPVRWVELNFGGGEISAADTVKAIEATAASATSTAQQVDEQLGLKPAAEPTAKEVTGDEIPF
jgi:hypothetical protein